MPKMKTNSGAKKRFALTGSGKIKRKHAFKSHILTKKTKKQKRNLTHTGLVASVDVITIFINRMHLAIKFILRDDANIQNRLELCLDQ